jgi:hypothetical protein
MKKLTNVSVSVVNGKATITGDVVEAGKHGFEHPVQQVTVGYINPKNMAWPRHCQLSHEAFFVKAFGQGVGIMLDDLVAIAAVLEPKTSYPPKASQLDGSLTVQIDSELQPTLQWELSDDGKDWKPIDGETTNALDRSKYKGKFVRLVASSEAGSITTNPILVA